MTNGTKNSVRAGRTDADLVAAAADMLQRAAIASSRGDTLSRDDYRAEYRLICEVLGKAPITFRS